MHSKLSGRTVGRLLLSAFLFGVALSVAFLQPGQSSVAYATEESSSSSVSSTTATPGNTQRAGGHRGHRTTDAKRDAAFLFRVLAGGYVPENVSEAHQTRLTANEKEFLCGMQKAGIYYQDATFLPYFSQYIAAMMRGAPSNAFVLLIEDYLTDPSLCRFWQEARKPVMIAVADPKKFYVNSDGFAVTSNVFFNNCFKHGGTTATNAREYKEQLWSNPQHGKYGPKPCYSYFSYGAGMEEWQLPNGLTFGFDRYTKKYRLPEDYVLSQQTAVVLK
jgi:hypothetical protein